MSAPPPAAAPSSAAAAAAAAAASTSAAAESSNSNKNTTTTTSSAPKPKPSPTSNATTTTTTTTSDSIPATTLLHPDSFLKGCKIDNRSTFDKIQLWLQRLPPQEPSTPSNPKNRIIKPNPMQLVALTCLVYRILHGKGRNVVSDVVTALRQVSTTLPDWTVQDLIRWLLPAVKRNFFRTTVLHSPSSSSPPPSSSSSSTAAPNHSDAVSRNLQNLKRELPPDCHPWLGYSDDNNKFTLLVTQLERILEQCDRVAVTYADFHAVYQSVAATPRWPQFSLAPPDPKETYQLCRVTRLLSLAWKLASRLHRHQDDRSPHWRARRLVASAAVWGCLTALPASRNNSNGSSSNNSNRIGGGAKNADDDADGDPNAAFGAIHDQVNALFQNHGLRIGAPQQPAVSHVSSQLLRSEIVTLTKELQVVLRDLRHNGLLPHTFVEPAATAAAASGANSSASNELSFIRELLGPLPSDELLWHIPAVIERLHEPDATAYLDLGHLVETAFAAYVAAIAPPLPKSSPPPAAAAAAKASVAATRTTTPAAKPSASAPAATTAAATKPSASAPAATTAAATKPSTAPAPAAANALKTATKPSTKATTATKPSATAKTTPAAAPAAPAKPSAAATKSKTTNAATTEPGLTYAPTELIKIAAQGMEKMSAKDNNFFATTPSILPEAMELNEWAVSISFPEVVKPSPALLDIMDSCGNAHPAAASGGGADHPQQSPSSTSPPSGCWQDVIIHRTLNKSLLRLSQEHLRDSKATRKAPVAVQSGAVAAGTVQVQGELTADKQLCKIVVALYYHALEAVHFCESKRWKKQYKKKKKKEAKNRERDYTSDNPEQPNNDDAVMATQRRVTLMLLNPSFHAALLACCTLCVTHAVGFTAKLHPSAYLRKNNILSVLEVTSATPYEFLKVSETFVRALSLESPARGKITSPLVFCLPASLRRYVRQTEIHLLDSFVWARTTTESLPDQIDDWTERTSQTVYPKLCLWPPQVLDLPEGDQEITPPNPLDGVKDGDVVYPEPDHELYTEIQSVSHVLSKLLQLARCRVHGLCRALQISSTQEASLISEQVLLAFRYLLRHRIELLYDRHVDHWLLCCLYGVCRTVQYRRPPSAASAADGPGPQLLTFVDILTAYVALRESELGPVVCQRIVRHIKIQSTSATSHTDGMGNVIALYNQVFVPAMKEHLLQSPSLKQCKAELERLQQQRPQPQLVDSDGDAAMKDANDDATATTTAQPLNQGRFDVSVAKFGSGSSMRGPVVTIRLGASGSREDTVTQANEFAGKKRKVTEV